MIHFVTYGDDKFIQSRERICNEARETGWFDTVTYYTDRSISEGFRRKFIEKTPETMKYYIWNFDVIIQSLQRVAEGDIVVYADAGCTINKTGKDRFNTYIESLNANQHMGFLVFTSTWQENKYTNNKLFDYFDIHRQSFIGLSGQNITTCYIMRKNAHAYKILNECLKVLTHDPLLITPLYDEENETHRHDQSILSIVTKLHGAVYFTDDTYNHPGLVGKEVSDTFPIIATRIRI